MIEFLDLTSLAGPESEADIVALCERARTPHGDVAAVCVYPRHVATCARRLAGSAVRVAAVANFPEGELDPERARRDALEALDAGADEVDVVLPWRAWLAGDRHAALQVIAPVREIAPTVKVIVESGRLGARTKDAARDVLASGADFVKTSTGKAGPGADPGAARAILEAIREAGHGGLKASGGVRTAEQAQAYLSLARELLGPVGPDRFRIGASGLLDELLRP